MPPHPRNSMRHHQQSDSPSLTSVDRRVVYNSPFPTQSWSPAAVHSFAGWTGPPGVEPSPPSIVEFDYDTPYSRRARRWSSSTHTESNNSQEDLNIQVYNEGRGPFSPHHGLAPELVSSAPKVLLHRGPTASRGPAHFLHPALAYYPAKFSDFAFDIALQPYRLPAEDEFALTPPTRSLRITCNLIPWEILVQGSTRGGGITCGDIIFSIHTALHKTLTGEEVQKLSKKQQEIIKDAFLRRCKDRAAMGLAENEAKEICKGMKRIDWLGNRTVFIGLSPSFEKEETWILTLGRRGRAGAN